MVLRRFSLVLLVVLLCFILFTGNLPSGQENKSKISPACPPSNQSPVAICELSPHKGQVQLKVRFDGSKSYDHDGWIEHYQWDFDDGTFGTGIVTNHTYTKVGKYTPVLTVSDNKGKEDQVSCCVITVSSKPAPSECDVLLIGFTTIVQKYLDENENYQYKVIVKWTVEEPKPDGYWVLYKTFYKPGEMHIKELLEIVPNRKFSSKGTTFAYTDIKISKYKTYYYVLKWVCSDEKCGTEFGPALAEIPKI